MKCYLVRTWYLPGTYSTVNAHTTDDTWKSVATIPVLYFVYDITTVVVAVAQVPTSVLWGRPRPSHQSGHGGGDIGAQLQKSTEQQQ